MRPLLLSIVAGMALAAAWSYPATILSATLGWIATLSLVAALFYGQGKARYPYLSGIIAFGIATVWLSHTISFFGGFGVFTASLLFTLFVVITGLQFALFAWLYRLMPSFMQRAGVRSASAWVIAELLFPGLFPWEMGHTQISFLPLVQVSDIAGSQLVSFLMFWVAEALLLKNSAATRIIPLCALGASLVYGVARISQYSNIDAPSQTIGVIQANVSIEEKHNIGMFQTNIGRYQELTRSISQPDTLIIWPESVVTEPIHDHISNISKSRTLSDLPKERSYLLGAVTFESSHRYFNSALAIQPDGRITGTYHKRVLMPFGEYMPLSHTFPWIKDLNPTAGDFTAGTKEHVFSYDMNGKAALKVSPLICYEDLVPSMSRDSVRAGAELLVNITNDAWYGRSAAPFQHHLIASFRAIENRRYLVRSTNTGYTAVVDAVGRTISSIPIFSEGTITAEVKLLSDKTLYTRLFSNHPFYALFGVYCLSVLFNLRRPKK